jgi:hypothetical protein
MKNADAREETIYLEVAGRSMDVHEATMLTLMRETVATPERAKAQVG